MPTIDQCSWGTSPDGPATLFTLVNDRGNTLSLTDYGGIITSIVVDGAEMVIGFDRLEDYLAPQPYYGALIGRYGNRIAGARFSLDGTTYTLPANHRGHQLHGGPRGFDKYGWRATTTRSETTASVVLTHRSPDGDMGFPGALEVTCTYTWTNEDELRITYAATTDKPTVVNLTNHSYFNIGRTATVTDHLLWLRASHFTPVDATMIPTGELAPVAGTPFDFTSPKPIGRGIGADHPQLKAAGGYDHNFVLDGWDGTLREVATVRDPATGRQLTCATTEPGLQLFTANFAPGEFRTRDGSPLPPQGALCLETQHFPNAPNLPSFPSTVLRPGATYHSVTTYRFG